MEYGWEWHSVASPALPDKCVEPTDEALNKFALSFRSGTNTVDVIRSALTHFATPTLDNRIPVTDEAVYTFFAAQGWHENWCKPQQIQDIVAHFSNPITGEGKLSDDEIDEVLRSRPNFSKAGPDGKSMHHDCVKAFAMSVADLRWFARSVHAKQAGRV